jgi:hypothetical protein
MIMKIKRIISLNQKVDSDFEEFCNGLFLDGIGSDIGIDEFSSACNFRLQRLAKDSIENFR